MLDESGQPQGKVPHPRVTGKFIIPKGIFVLGNSAIGKGIWNLVYCLFFCHFVTVVSGENASAKQKHQVTGNFLTSPTEIPTQSNVRNR